tara:strand:+ start:9278 stop:9448 length:171 start_codon:yes stop_codon:yes gene_type:complete
MERHETTSHHARRRSQQRGIPLSLVEKILDHGYRHIRIALMKRFNALGAAEIVRLA